MVYIIFPGLLPRAGRSAPVLGALWRAVHKRCTLMTSSSGRGRAEAWPGG